MALLPGAVTILVCFARRVPGSIRGTKDRQSCASLQHPASNAVSRIPAFGACRDVSFTVDVLARSPRSPPSFTLSAGSGLGQAPQQRWGVGSRPGSSPRPWVSSRTILRGTAGFTPPCPGSSLVFGPLPILPAPPCSPPAKSPSQPNSPSRGHVSPVLGTGHNTCMDKPRPEGMLGPLE